MSCGLIEKLMFSLCLTSSATLGQNNAVGQDSTCSSLEGNSVAVTSWFGEDVVLTTTSFRHTALLDNVPLTAPRHLHAVMFHPTCWPPVIVLIHNVREAWQALALENQAQLAFTWSMGWTCVEGRWEDWEEHGHCIPGCCPVNSVVCFGLDTFFRWTENEFSSVEREVIPSVFLVLLPVWRWHDKKKAKITAAQFDVFDVLCSLHLLMKHVILSVLAFTEILKCKAWIA